MESFAESLFAAIEIFSPEFYALAGVLALAGAYYLYKNSKKEKFTPGITPMLDRFSRDLTLDASRGKIDPLIGREQEIKRLIQILCRRTKNNAILVGEAGTGKTALAEGLAVAMVNKKVPPEISGKRVLALNLGGMLAGTQYRGEFENRMKIITDELSLAGRNIILFVDEIQNLTQAGEATGAIGAANLLKPALARGDIQAIGASTIEDYFIYIGRDTSLERRFQPIMVKEATSEETLKILAGIKSKYENFHRVKISDEVINAVVELAEKYMSDRYFPDKAIDVIDEAAAKVQLEALEQNSPEKIKWPQVTVKDVESVIFQWGRDITELKKRAQARK